MLEYRFHSGAEYDLTEAAAYYAQQRDNLGERFISAVELSIRSIREHPHMGVQIDEIYRQNSVPRFPFTVIYRIARNELVIIAIAHRGRRPGFWRGRD